MFFAWMNRPDGSRVAYVLRMALMAFTGAILVAVILSDYMVESPDQGAGMGVVFTVLVLAPVIETLIMWGIFIGLGFFLHDFRMKAFVSGGIWAGVYAASAPLSGVIMFWPFLLFSITFLVWERRSINEALIMTISTHALFNLVPALMFLTEAG